MLNALWFMDMKQLFTGRTKRNDQRQDPGRRSDTEQSGISGKSLRRHLGSKGARGDQGKGVRFAKEKRRPPAFAILRQKSSICSQIRRAPTSPSTGEIRLGYSDVRTLFCAVRSLVSWLVLISTLGC